MYLHSLRYYHNKGVIMDNFCMAIRVSAAGVVTDCPTCHITFCKH